LPTLSVAIPARNETNDLEACLHSLISSNYPKLEILVLDDCSQNKRTPEIIRDFAQSGVRFVAGQAPPPNWLAKNYAYARLADEANGDFLLFCGVDTRFQPDTLRAMVEALLQKNKTMVSFVPRNHAPPRFSVESLLVQPARYSWELSPPRRLRQRPPVLSTCWLIKSSELQASGGFAAVSRSISPESYFARQTAHRNDGYSFMQSDEVIDLGSAKSLAAQRATAVRTRYPQLHRRPELVALSSLGELAAMVWPFGLLVSAFLNGQWPLLAISVITITLLVSFYARVVHLTYRRFLWRGLWTLPLVAIYDMGLLNYSMWAYEFREVIWKGRNVCVPMMRRPTSSLGKRP
jgi:glycosyltransferase involved in cell wall biosynthesis